MSIVLAEKQQSEKNLNAKTGSSLSIRELLKIPPDLRTFQHCRDIITHVKVIDLNLFLTQIGRQIPWEIYGQWANLRSCQGIQASVIWAKYYCL